MTTNYYITMYCKVQISCHKCSMRAKICDTVFCTNMTNIILQKVLHWDWTVALQQLTMIYLSTPHLPVVLESM